MIALLVALSLVTSQDPLAARVDSLMDSYKDAGRPGVQVAVVKDGKILLERGYGSAQLEHKIPITPATVFHVASVSKQFTAFAIALLAQQQKLNLDDDIRKRLTELNSLPHKITIRQLIHHTSGVRDQWDLVQMSGNRMDDVITRDQIMSLMMRQRELNFEPGSEHLYSNMGYSLLAEIVERVSGQRFGAFLQNSVFQPLGMKSTHVHNDHQMVVPNRAYSYAPGPDNTWRNAVLSYANQGATSLFTTAGDLARWLHNFETGAVGGPALIRQMRERGVLTKGDTLSYAFAIARGIHHGRENWGHSGGDAGFRSFVTHFPNERLGIVVLSNAADVNPARLAMTIASIYLGETPLASSTPTNQRPRDEPPLPWRPASTELRAFTGDYYSPELATLYTIEQRADSLWVRNRHSELRLSPADKDAFRSGNRMVRFVRDSAGAVNAFSLSTGRVRNLKFVKLKEPLPTLR